MNITVTILEKEFSLPANSSVSFCFSKAKLNNSKRYSDNPIVGAFYNNRAVSLSTVLPASGSLEPIRAFDPIGRRIYRHSICFLLSYAAKLVFPDRHLVIGHSLGDGFYFSFAEESSCDSDFVEKIADKISNKMKELCNSKIEINKVSIPFEKAYSYFETNGSIATCKALSFKNNPEVEVYSINDYYDIAYEPIVDNTEVLSTWKLISYKNKGMLLRYPVSSDIYNVATEHKDHSNLFSIFEEYKNWGKILGVSSVGDMNCKIVGQTVDSYVRLSESLQRRKIASIADKIFERKSKAVFIAGPSSSGKTTFAKKLCEQLQMLGCETIRISLDDYYRPRQELPKNDKSEPDYECLEALLIDLFYQNMKDIFSGKEVHLPIWNFSKQERKFEDKAVALKTNSVFVIEGIHGLNPKIMDSVDPKDRFSVYISALTQLNLDDHNRVSTTDNRIIRRIVRDYRTRGVSAFVTLSMWDDVEKGERKHIFPFQNNADVMFNSALDYELGVLSPYVTPLLREVNPQQKEAYSMARRLLEFLDNFYAIPAELVPSDSILREFIGSSDYE